MMYEILSVCCQVLCILAIQHLEELAFLPGEERTKKTLGEAFALCLLSLLIVLNRKNCDISPAQNGNLDGVLYLVLWANILLAVLWDVRSFLVYRFVWLINGCVLGLLLFLNPPQITSFLAVIFYFIFQECICRHYYGAADAHCFSCFAFMLLAEAGHNPEILLYCLMHMVISFLLLGGVSILQGNVNRRGNLKQPVPFIPYLVFAFCIMKSLLVPPT